MKAEPAFVKVGVNAKRKCHDIIFLLLLIVFWIGMFFVANTAFKYGDVTLLLKPQDSYGNHCGTNYSQNGTNLMNLPYLYYNNLASPMASPFECVASCPNVTSIPTLSNYICNYGINLTLSNFASLTAQFQCAPLLIKSAPILNRCIPNDPAFTNLSASALSSSQNAMQDIFQDIQIAWPYYIAAVFISLVVSFIWVWMMRLFAKPMVWLTVILINLFFAAIAGACYYFWVMEQTMVDSSFVATERAIGQYGTYIFLALFILMVIFTIFMRNKIRIACEVLKETSIAIGKMPFIIFFPLTIWLLCILLLVYFIYVALFLVSINTGVTLSGLNIQMSSKYSVYYLLIYHVFGFFWLYAWFQGINQTTVAGSFATYYWLLDKANMPNGTIRKSLWRTSCYHLGSIALGAMLIAIVQTLRVIMMVFKRMAKKSKLKFLMPLINCCQCCLAWLEKLVKWINKNSYIMIAIEGKAFCESCTLALGLLMRNALRLLAVDFVSDFIIILSKVCITASTVGILYAFIIWQANLIHIKIIYVPLAIVGIIAFMVASTFMSIYALGIDTIFMCFLIDSEKNDGSPDRPYYMSDSLKNIMHVSNKMRVSDCLCILIFEVTGNL
ncbi:plasma-membrane choline transporter-domain-containing protein [Chytriomyces sp. MP71]|nr:plasma-membrane choline transporter-domain-containing protein [Chytriomyces sp. MP71]